MNQSQLEINLVHKIIIVGDAGVGKSCLLYKYTKNQKLEELYNATVGLDFQYKNITIDNKYQFKLQIWDTAGQENFQSIIKSFYRNSSAIFLVYNITDRQSFDNLHQWYEEAKNNSQESSVFVLVGAQKDKQNQREVQYEEGQKFAAYNDITLFFETSALDGSNVEESFDQTAKIILRNELLGKYNQSVRLIQSKVNSSIRTRSTNSIDDVQYYQAQKRMNLEIQEKEEKSKKKCC